ncbi:MAG: phytoene desaturase family protein [Planctomycetota bacterium]
MIASPPATASEGSVAIVGAGPGGLASAILLAASGVRVTVYEARDRVGGRSERVSVGDYGFDRGPTFFLMPYVLDEIFRAAGRSLGDEVDLRPLDPMYRLIIGSESGGEPTTIDATRDTREMARRLAKIDPSDGANFERFIADNRAKLSAAEPILRRPIRSPLDLVRPDAMRALPHIKPHLTVQQLLSKYFKNPAVQRAVSFQSKYLGMSPYDCPSLFTILPFIEYEYGIWHPIGGCNALMTAMARVVEDLGGEVRVSSPVERVTFTGRRADGVMVGGERLPHDHVVVNADAAWAIKHLIPDEVRRSTKYAGDRIDSRRYSCSTFMMYLGVDGTVDLPHHTIYISEKYRDNLADIGERGRLSDDASIYLCNASVTDETLAPPGKSSLYVLLPTPNLTADLDWAVHRDAAERLCLEQLERRLGVPDLERRIEAKEIVSPRDWAGMNINFGATFNLAHNLGQMLHYRPHHKLEGFDSLWLVGGGTHPGSGLPVIFLSSQITSRLVCDALGHRYAGEVGDGPAASGDGGSREPSGRETPAIPA